jgi:hypothetical protein
MKFAALVFCILAACTVGEEDQPAGSDEPADYELDEKGDGLSATFNQNNVVDDALFAGTMTVADVQKFLEQSPYNNRSWLADFTADGKSAAQLIVDAAVSERVSPMMLLARMQVEASLVSKTVKPTQSRVDKALGCGCPDGGGCASQYRGFGPQLLCGAKILRKWYDGSAAGNGIWNKGVAKRTLDPKTVTPANHATASLYAYTPWVLTGSGGNWLVWNVTRKYTRHADAKGLAY